MPSLNRLVIGFKALRQLGLEPLALYGLYRVGLRTGHYKRVENREQRIEISDSRFEIRDLFNLPSRDELLKVLGKDGKEKLLAEANEIAAGKARLFGGEPVDLQLTFDAPLEHWTAYETTPSLFSNLYSPISDIKFIWEPSRFGSAFTLGRAYYLSGDEKYAEAFWHFTETFLDANPPYLGPNWMSGQEAALRLMAFVWAAQVFAASSHSTPERMQRLAKAVAQHAARIPPTLVYARSQQNNHLLTEAAGLFTAGLALAEHLQAEKWRKLGWKWLNWGFQHQIDGYGEYTQHSTNYHRLMLQVALWINVIARSEATKQSPVTSNNEIAYPAGTLSLPAVARNDILARVTKLHKGFPRKTLERLAAATHWLLALLDPVSGRTPILGANDGAYIFPLTVCPFDDFRPVLQAAARAFLDYELPRGPWDEMCLWFDIPLASKKYFKTESYLGDHLYAKKSWAYLRTAQFTSRPSHADQLHLDLWWRGLNIAQDAGTYLYNAAAPWDNALTTTLVHNTVSVNGRDQMTRAGRFLYLDWADAYRKTHLETDETILQRASAKHNSYLRQGVRHERTVTVYADERWQVEDELLTLRRIRKPLIFRLHWLLPDWEWEVENRESRFEIRLKSPYGWVILRIEANPSFSRVGLVHAGELIYGQGSISPIMGWVSPTYGVKIPALSFAVDTTSDETVKFTSEFAFPTDN